VSSDSETEISSHQLKASEAIVSKVAASGASQGSINQKPQKITELQQLVESIRLAVTCLYKLPLRKPAPIDRLSDKSTEEVSYFQQFDILYVRDKFRDRLLGQRAHRLDDQVKVRLGKMITRRRQLLLYRERHRDNLLPDVVTPQEKRRKEPETGTKHEAAIANTTNALETQSHAESSHITKASTLHEEALPHRDVNDLLAPSVAGSEATSLVASEATRDIRIEVPPRPKDHTGRGLNRFECNYCCLTQHIRSDRAWK
jgi:hypothetical protein